MMTNPYYKKWWFGNQPIEKWWKRTSRASTRLDFHMLNMPIFLRQIPRQDFCRAMADALQEIVEIDAEQVGMTEAIGTWAMKKGPWLFAVYIGDEILPIYTRFILCHYKDPYQPTRISWNKGKGFHHCSLGPLVLGYWHARRLSHWRTRSWKASGTQIGH